jgi:hypothetical protein
MREREGKTIQGHAQQKTKWWTEGALESFPHGKPVYICFEHKPLCYAERDATEGRRLRVSV